ncbi:uncharacterized protein MESR4 [Cloeon dipterum]|uniref:uncharacterized protein MESR4 n=1 Tax=Cloeon dipterum TaxID=197152 RepID=UPI0032202230
MEYDSGLEITALPVRKYNKHVLSSDDDAANVHVDSRWGDIVNGHHHSLSASPFYFSELGAASPLPPPRKKAYQNPAAIELDDTSAFYEDTRTANPQPLVRFQCVKCKEGGFETLPALKEHQRHCLKIRKIIPSANRTRRKIYFCNSCGTYHSGCDLYLHTLQVHQRHVCLFCMATFMRADKLAYHLRTRHRLLNVNSTLAEFISNYSNGCLLSCCSCSRLFSETDNFCGHDCQRPKNKAAKSESYGVPHGENHKHPASHSASNFTLPQLKDVTIIPINKGGGKKEASQSPPKTPSLKIKLSVPKKSSKKLKTLPEPPPPVPEPPAPAPEPPASEPPAVVDEPATPDNELPIRLNGESSMLDSDLSRNEESDWTQSEPPPSIEPALPEPEVEPEPEPVEEPPPPPAEEDIQLANEDSPLIDLYINKSLEEQHIQELLKQAITEVCSICVYCTHAVKIAVNGKQLALHLLSEHRFQLIFDKEQLPLTSFIELLKSKLTELENAFFNCDSYDNMQELDAQPKFMRHYECFQCRYVTLLHKELYLHNRKMHQKHSLVCTMCRTNFFNYSELLCHLCPGTYIDNYSTKFRCCFCSVDNLPSSFRLMVHLRKCHLSCEVCLETTPDQAKLSGHVWKHKLNHFCHKCCIAYRNKTDMTRHLFWKHGTESVVCKKCLQKKWPYVYHFCIPPPQFTCEECGLTFGKAVALKVHKRLHTNDFRYPCGECNESFISRKVLARHDRSIHNPLPLPPPPPPPLPEEEEKLDVEKDSISTDVENSLPVDSAMKSEPTVVSSDRVDSVEKKTPPSVEKKTTPKRDVLDLPPLNLSSDSETDSDVEDGPVKTKEDSPVKNESSVAESETPKEEVGLDATVTAAPTDSVWDSFKDQNEPKAEANQETVLEPEGKVAEPASVPEEVKEPEPAPPAPPQLNAEELSLVTQSDHDYFNVLAYDPDEPPVDEPPMPVLENFQIPSDSIVASFTEGIQLSPPRFYKRRRQESSGSSSDSSSSSSGSDSSSCSCSSSNCSCGSGSSSSGSSSSSSSDSGSDNNEKKTRKLKKKLKKKTKGEQSLPNGAAQAAVEEEEDEHIDLGPPVLYFHESDLDTNESASDDENFYDEHPRKPGLNRPPTLSSIFSPSITPAPTPPPSLENGVAGGGGGSLDTVLPQQLDHKSKPKKKKRQSQHHHSSPSQPQSKKRKDHWSPDAIYESNLRFFLANQLKKKPSQPEQLGTEIVDGNRSSKRKRVPKRFYGDNEQENSGMSGMGLFSPVPLLPVITPRPSKKKSRSSSIVSESTTPQRPLSPREMTESERHLTDVIDFVALGRDGKTAEDHEYRRRPKLVITLPTSSFNRYSEEAAAASDSSSEADYDSDDEDEPEPSMSPIQDAIETFTRAHPSEQQQQAQDTKLYCYCRCPYDEVSEMIGCDDPNCKHEWYHFDCVGIKVPPVGTWYCPECLKKQALAAT